MIYIDGVRQKDFTKEKAILEKLFYNSFSEDGTRTPIMIRQSKGKSVVTSLYKPGADTPFGQRVAKPLPTYIRAHGRFRGEDGLMHTWNYTETPPSYEKDGEPKFKTRHIQVYDGMPIDPVADLEKVIMLYFYSTNFSNGVIGNKNGLFEFVIPAQESKKRIDNAMSTLRYVNEIINPDTRMSSSMLKDVMSLLSIKGTGVEEDDRVKLYDMIVQGTRGHKERYSRAVENAEAMNAKRTVTGDMTGAATAVKSAIKNNLLVEEDGMWVLKNEAGEVKLVITEVRGTKKSDKEMGLVEYLSANIVVLEQITSNVK